VRPVTAGYKTWLIEPQPGDLTWAKGSVPTPYGSIEVRWEKEGNGLELKIFVPPGTSGTVGLPASSGTASLTDNGRTFAPVNKSNGRPGYTYLENVGPGAHSFQLTASQN
jgi:alpha-L-rhamnosidase